MIALPPVLAKMSYDMLSLSRIALFTTMTFCIGGGFCAVAYADDAGDAIATGRALAEQGKEAEAIPYFDTAIILYRSAGDDSNLAMAYDNRSHAYFSLRQYDAAIQDYNEAVMVDSTGQCGTANKGSAYIARGNAYLDLGKIDSAIQDYTDGIRLEPQYAGGYLNRGNAYTKLGHYDAALQDFTAAIRLDPTGQCGTTRKGSAYYRRGNVRAALRQNDSAMQDYGGAILLDTQYAADIRRDTQNAAAHNLFGFIYFSGGKYDSAIQDYTEAVRLDTQYAMGYYLRGIAFELLGQYDAAIQDYNEAIRLDAHNSTAYYMRGLAFGALGQNDRAIQDFNEAVRLDTQNASAYYNRGSSYKLLAQNDRAIADYSEAIRLDSTGQCGTPNKGAAFYWRGVVYTILGQYDSAIQDYTEAISLDSTGLKGAAHNNRGAAYQLSGQLDSSIKDYHEALRLNPQFANAYATAGQHDLPVGIFDFLTGKTSTQAGANVLGSLEERQTFRRNPYLREFFGNNLSEAGFKKDRDTGPVMAKIEAAIVDSSAEAYTARGWLNFGMLLGSLLKPGEDWIKWNQAQQDFRAALEINPQDGLAYTGLGHAEMLGAISLQQQGSITTPAFLTVLVSSMTHLAQALEIDSGDAAAKRNIGYEVTWFVGDVGFEPALVDKYWRMVTADNSTKEFFLVPRAKAFMKMNQYDLALLDLDEALTSSRDPEIHRLRAEVLTLLGRIDEGEAELRLAGDGAKLSPEAMQGVAAWRKRDEGFRARNAGDRDRAFQILLNAIELNSVVVPK